MFGRKVTVLRLFGFVVKVDGSWVFLAMLVSWSLAQGPFPHMLPGHAPALYGWMGFAGTVGLFVPIVLHKLGHSPGDLLKFLSLKMDLEREKALPSGSTPLWHSGSSSDRK